MRLLLLLTWLTISSLSFGQSIERELLSNGGDYFENATAQISFSIGEPIAETLFNLNNDLTQGFHQGIMTIIGINEIPETVAVSVYPNPSNGQLNIQFETYPEQVIVTISSIDGRILRDQSCNNRLVQFDLTDLSSGIYLLTIRKGQRIINTQRIIKH